MSEPTPSSYQPPQKSNRNAIIIALLSVVIVVQAIKIYLDSREKQTINTDLTSTKQELATTEQRLREISTELDQRITEITKLGGNVTDLEKAKADIEAELNRSRRATESGPR